MYKIIVFICLQLLLGEKTIQSQTVISPDSIQNSEQLNGVSDSISNLILKYYVFPDKSIQISNEYLKWSQRRFKTFPISYADYAKEASEMLKTISKDKHFFVQAPKKKKSAGALVASSTWFLGPSKGYGLTKYELLDGNVAYFKYAFFNFMMMPDATKVIDRMIAQMHLSDAIIIDLRDNPGGDGGMAEYFFSYFIPEDSIYLSSNTSRANNGEIQYSENFSVKILPEKRIEGKPVFILVNSKTGSSAEYFAFLAKIHKKAIIIGEQTAGAGHSLTTLKVNDYLTIGVPSSRIFDKITNTDWEETNGVVPDVIITDNQPIETAHKIALEAHQSKK